MKCYQAKAGELAKQWFVIDATDKVVGRLATQIATILMGKHRPTYTPHIDTGDYVIVTNVDKVVFTGNKWQQKSYQRYTGHPGGQREEVAWKLFKRHPDRILQLAVQRMMPKNKIGRHMLGKLKLYAGPQHPHQAQAPIPLDGVTGHPAPAGALLAPKPEPKAPKPRVKAAKDGAVAETPQAEASAAPVSTPPAPAAEATTPAPEPTTPEAASTPAPEASAPNPEASAPAPQDTPPAAE